MDSSERQKRSFAIATRLSRYLSFRKANRIGLYLPMMEEVDTHPVMEICRQLTKQVFVPVIDFARWRNNKMQFHPYESGTTELRKTKLGILEPVYKPGSPINGTELDLVCVPTVAFNRTCDRIGMGGGYYDRAFEKRLIRPTKLVGIAFDCQEAEFTARTHDVPMDAVVTESTIYVR